jgi:hypothetical protein
VRRRWLLALSPALVLGVGCTPELYAITPAPPLRVLALDPIHDRIELSEATAIAFECTREGYPCRDLHAAVDGADVAVVYATELSVLRGFGFGSRSNVSALTLVGLKPGRATLRVTSEGWMHEYVVEVVAAP